MIYLLLVEQGDKYHYVDIKHIGRLLNLHHHMQDKDTQYCPCCRWYIKLNEFSKHISKCSKLTLQTLNESTKVSLPEVSKKGHKPTMKFENYKNKTMRPYIIYADTECTNVESNDKNNVSTHMVNSVMAYLVCEHDEIQNQELVWYGKNCIINMIFDLCIIAEECVEICEKNKKWK